MTAVPDIEFRGVTKRYGSVTAVSGIDLAIPPSAFVALLGPSGCGKTTCLRMIGGFEQPSEGAVFIRGRDMAGTPPYRRPVNMVFQQYALFPHLDVEDNIAYGLRQARPRLAPREISLRAGEALAMVRLAGYGRRKIHELSGGQRQRVVIAIACALKPKLLIADEPTTALDVVLQAQILDLLRDLVAENRMGLLLISHDLAVVTEMADRITILRHGEVMEAGDTARTLSEQLHPYTRQLAQASMHVPARARTHEIGQDTPLLQGAKPLVQVDSVTRDYPGRRPSLLKRAAPIRAVDDVSFSIDPGQSVALVGRSGCGKSTLARMILALDGPTSGTIRFRG
ncbi:MAG: ABC transporter ATP-binding protein, partial [Mesorhizobium sp.]